MAPPDPCSTIRVPRKDRHGSRMPGRVRWGARILTLRSRSRRSAHRKGPLERNAVKFTPTELEGAIIVDVEPPSDERGLFARAFCARAFTVLARAAADPVQANRWEQRRVGNACVMRGDSRWSPA